MSLETTANGSGWHALFWEAFRRSKNAMVLLDDQRCHVEVNGAYLALVGCRRSELIGRPVYERVADGPLVTTRQWHALLRQKQFTGAADLICTGARRVTVEFAGHPEVVTGKRLVLFVATRTGPASRPLRDTPLTPSVCAAFSSRELEVIRLLADGLTGPEVATQLQLAHNTVRTHVRNAMAKAGSHSRAQLVAMTMAEGLLWHASS